LGKIREIIRQTDRVGISAFGYFLTGSPGDTWDTMRQTVDFAKSLPLDFAIFNSLTPFPKTPLYEEYYLPCTAHDFWADYIRSPKPLDTFIGRPWIDIDDEAIARFTHKAMLEFYFRPKQVWRAIKSVRSVDMFWRYCRAGVDMTIDYAMNFGKKSIS
jgi:hypothetical protein